MADVHTKPQRRRNMQAIRGKDTKPECKVRSALHQLGYRFRLHRPDLPGKPDIVLPRHRTVIFVHGCFWHRHPNCRFAYTPKSRVEFWQRKFADNVRRDRRAAKQLRKAGWRVVTIWECQTRQPTRLARRLERLFVDSDEAKGW